MADVDLTVYEIDKDGLNLTDSASTIVVANTYYFTNTGKEKLLVFNVSGFTCVVTIDTPNALDDDLDVPSREVSIATAKNYAIGDLKPSIYNQSNGKVKVTFDQIVTAIAVR